MLIRIFTSVILFAIFFSRTVIAEEVTDDYLSALSLVFEKIENSSLEKNDIQNLTLQGQSNLLSLYASDGNIEQIKNLLGMQIEVNTVNSMHGNALLTAVFSENLELVKLLLDSGADKRKEIDGQTIFEIVLLNSSPEMKTLFITEEQLPLSELLRRAAREGNEPIVKDLLSQGVNTNKVDSDSYTALMEAVVAGNESIAQLLLAKGANPKIQTKDGLTIAGIVAMNGSASLMEALLAKGVNPNSEMRGVSLLTTAIIADNKEVVTTLLNLGADPQRKGIDGSTPARIANSLGKSDLVEMLGGIPEFKMSTSLLASIEEGSEAGVIEALKEGADPNMLSGGKVPVLLVAAAKGHDEIVRVLLGKGADIYSVGPDGSNIFQVIISNFERRGTNVYVTMLFEIIPQQKVIKNLLGMKDHSGRSAYVSLSLSANFLDRMRHISNGQYFMNKISLSLANTPDADGISPYIGAVLSGNTELLKLYNNENIEPIGPSRSISLQDIARSKKMWKSLAFLPNDRLIPKGFKKGATLYTKKIMQGKLKEWGYYHGGIDGLFGPGSRAAMLAFLRDRQIEIRGIGWNHSYARVSGNLSDWCTWKTTTWDSGEENLADEYIGCGDNRKTGRNGFGYFHFGNGESDLYLFGQEGWAERDYLR